MPVDQVVALLERHACRANVEGMARYGIAKIKAYGWNAPALRALAKQIGPDQSLARGLWRKPTLETRILATLVADPEQTTEADIDRWVTDLRNWAICDALCMNLLWKLPFAYRKASELAGREEEFEKRAGFALVAVLALKDKQAGDERIARFLPVIERGAGDDRNFVKKAVSWALRHIGKRNLALNARAVAVAERLKQREERAARWVGSDAWRELTGERVQERLRK